MFSSRYLLVSISISSPQNLQGRSRSSQYLAQSLCLHVPWSQYSQRTSPLLCSMLLTSFCAGIGYHPIMLLLLKMNNFFAYTTNIGFSKSDFLNSPSIGVGFRPFRASDINFALPIDTVRQGESNA